MATPVTEARIDSSRNPNHVQPTEGPRPGRDEICPTCYQALINSEAPDCGQPLEMHEPCGAVFHHSCLEPWLRDNSNCPWCRDPLRYAGNGEPVQELVTHNNQSISWHYHVLHLSLAQTRPVISNVNLSHQQIASHLHAVTEILQQIRAIFLDTDNIEIRLLTTLLIALYDQLQQILLLYENAIDQCRRIQSLLTMFEERLVAFAREIDRSIYPLTQTANHISDVHSHYLHMRGHFHEMLATHRGFRQDTIWQQFYYQLAVLEFMCSPLSPYATFMSAILQQEARRYHDSQNPTTVAAVWSLLEPLVSRGLMRDRQDIVQMSAARFQVGADMRNRAFHW